MKKNIGICAIILVFAVLLSGCATNKMPLNAQGIAEGIRLHFNRIPDRTTRLFVSLFDTTVDDGLQTFVDINGDELEKIKNTKELICPFVKNGHAYTVFVYCYAGNEISDAEYSVISSGGIYPVNDPLLYLDTENNSVTLSAKPMFSKEITYDSFWYQLVVKPDDLPGQSYSYSEGSHELTWHFSPMKDRLIEAYGLKGDLPAFVSAYGEIKQGNIVWHVGIANSDEFTVAF
jgi:hypothetical protein